MVLIEIYRARKKKKGLENSSKSNNTEKVYQVFCSSLPFETDDFSPQATDDIKRKF